MQYIKALAYQTFLATAGFGLFSVLAVLLMVFIRSGFGII